jgi:hypothetical protein
VATRHFLPLKQRAPETENPVFAELSGNWLERARTTLNRGQGSYLTLCSFAFPLEIEGMVLHGRKLNQDEDVVWVVNATEDPLRKSPAQG